MCLVLVQTILNGEITQNYLYKKPYLRTNYIEASIEEGIDLKNQNRI